MSGGNKKLKTGLYGVPILLVFVMALAIYAVFHLVVNAYVARLAERNIETRFACLDAYHQSSAFDGYYDDGSDFIITVRHMILDRDGKLLYPGAPWESEEERERTEEILARYAGGRLPLRDGRGTTLAIGEKSFYLMQRSYTGRYDGAFVVQSRAGQVYPVLAYIDITPVAAFLQLLNRVLLLLTVGLALAAAAVLLSAGRGLDRSFQTLKAYILRAGGRGALAAADPLPYAEFNEITATVFQMSRMIEEAGAAQLKFFQNASHELRTPLTAIRGYAEGLAAGVIREPRAAAEIIMANSDRMSALVDELLYTSRLDAHREAEDEGPFDLRETAGRCVWAIAGKAESAGLRLELQLPEEEIVLSGSEERIERALSNILTNALRYARTRIALSLTAGAASAVITVTDDGEGISPEDLPHLFERFYKGRGGVTGLGLSIAQEAVRRHGGGITAASEQGRTVFTVTLPRKTG